MSIRHPCLCIPLALALGVSGSAQSSYFFVSGNVMTGLTWHAPQPNGSGCPTTGVVQYSSAPFHTDTTASNYDLTLAFPSYQTGFLFLYQDVFDPQNPCVGLFAMGFAPVANLNYLHLDANRQYFVVASEAVLFGGGGAFQVLINGPPGSQMFAGILGSLTSSVSAISLYAGGSQPWTLDAGPSHGGEAYLVLGSMSGTAPGIAVNSSVTLPLNFDSWFEFTLMNPNSAPLNQSLGTLDVAGRAQAGGITLPPGLPSSLVGLTAAHAFVTFAAATGDVAFVSNPLPLVLTQ